MLWPGSLWQSKDKGCYKETATKSVDGQGRHAYIQGCRVFTALWSSLCCGQDAWVPSNVRPPVWWSLGQSSCGMSVLVGRRGRSQSDHKRGQKQSHVSPKWLTGQEAGSPRTLNLPARRPWMPGLQVCWEIHVCCPGHPLCILLERSEQTTMQVECGFLASSPAGTSAEACISPLFAQTSPTEILKNIQLLVSQLHKASVFFHAQFASYTCVTGLP